MSEPWVVIIGLAATTVAIRASGPVMLGGRELPPRAIDVIELLAPALLAALVAVETFGGHDMNLVLDERAIGVAGAGVTILMRGSILLAMAVAVGLTAGARALL
jgi:branched-subunit amino acid transport protein